MTFILKPSNAPKIHISKKENLAPENGQITNRILIGSYKKVHFFTSFNYITCSKDQKGATKIRKEKKRKSMESTSKNPNRGTFPGSKK